jgi:hypothetical protein
MPGSGTRPGDVAGAIQQGTFTGVATAAKSAGKVTVNVNGILRAMHIARDLTVGSGDVVLVHRFGSLWIASSRLYEAGVSEMPPVIADLDPNPTVITGALACLPVDTSTYQNSAWLPDQRFIRQGVRGGNSNATGAAFYGDKPRSLEGATVTSARLEKIVVLDGPSPAAASTLRLITETTRPSGAPTLTSTTPGPIMRVGEDISFTVPTAWAQAMVDGTAGGIGVFDADGVPFVQYGGRGIYPSAFTLVIDWSRTV